MPRNQAISQKQAEFAGKRGAKERVYAQKSGHFAETGDDAWAKTREKGTCMPRNQAALQ